MNKNIQKQIQKSKAVQKNLQSELQYIESVEEFLKLEDEKEEIKTIQRKLSS